MFVFKKIIAATFLSYLALHSMIGGAFADPPAPSTTGTTQDPNRIMPDNGWWWAKTEPGRGYSIEAKLRTGTAFIATFVYGNNGKSAWYAAVLNAQPTSIIASGFYGPFSISTPLTGDLMMYSGGQTLGGAFKAAAGTNVGKITMTFTGQTTGTIDWPASLSKTQTQISRYPVVGTTVTAQDSNIVPQSGWWYTPAEGGRGYFFEIQGSTVFFAAYMYRTDGTAVWYIAGPVAMTTPSSMAANLIEVANGPTFATPTVNNGVSTNAGSMSASFTSPTSGTIILNGGTPIPITRYTGF